MSTLSIQDRKLEHFNAENDEENIFDKIASEFHNRRPESARVKLPNRDSFFLGH